ncbi:MAG TPA: hypothetical protein VFS18_03405, partial [Actinomycetota bacterium]|nr:hypothetical protein [Actinomycetota bacterium]
MMKPRWLRRTPAHLLVLGVLLMTVGAAHAGTTAPGLGSGGVSLEGCYEQTAFFPIPRDQAASYLPKGFRPSGSPAGEPSLIN